MVMRVLALWLVLAVLWAGTPQGWQLIASFLHLR